MNSFIKKIVITVFALSLASLGACTSSDQETEGTALETLTADFVPPSGAGDHEGTEGPWARRLLGAQSTDGLNWTKSNIVISDQADVADLVVDENGRLYMYYYAWKIGDKENLTAMAISDDNGDTWVFKKMEFSGFPNRGDLADPNVIYEDGVFHIYGSTREMGETMNTGKTYILHGESTDGISFTYKSVAFEPDSGNAGVASVFKTGDSWSLMSLASIGFNDGTEMGTVWRASSVEGDTFILKDTVIFKDEETVYFHGNVVPFEDGYRLYVFSGQTPWIKSFFSEDADEWELEDGYRLTLDKSSDLESGFVSDPDVIQLSDGTYFMVYSTLIP